MNRYLCLIQVRSKVLVQAFTKSLKDPFPFARRAGLIGIGASTASLSNEDIATRLIPAISSILIDPKMFLMLISGK
jgi:SCY1-like protein 1